MEKEFIQDHQMGREGYAMIKSSKFAFLCLIVPSLILLTLTFYKSHLLSSGREIELPISGYDPRDLLAGHYLIYQVDYGVETSCYQDNKGKDEAYVCLDNKTFHKGEVPSDCQLFIRGTCEYSRFKAGIERFYIPQDKASELEKIVLKNKSKIKLSVLPNGVAMVKDIIFVE